MTSKKIIRRSEATSPSLVSVPAPHPAAVVWPMLPEPDLRRLAADIKENGLRHPVVLDTGGLVLDGRNRLAACQIAGIEPEYETYEGDPVAYVLSSNERRHMTLPERAAAVALTLAADGRRHNGRWKYGAVNETAPESHNRGNWTEYMRRAGLVLDHAPDLLPQVAAGILALDAAVNEATRVREQKAQLAGLPADLRTLVEAREVTIADALRRAALAERYTNLVASGDLSLEEAEHLSERDDREHREAIQRAVAAIEGFLFGWPVATTLHKTAIRDDVLAALSDQDRERFLKIEEATTWPTVTL